MSEPESSAVMSERVVTLLTEMRQVTKTVERIESRLEGLATREELKDFVRRHEFDAFRAESTRGSPKTLFQQLTAFATGVVSIAAAGGVIYAVIAFAQGHH